MALTTAQINAIYAALFGPANLPTAAQLAFWEALDAAPNGGDAAVISGIVNSPASMSSDYAVVQIIEFVQGSVPTAAQLQGWAAYVEAGGALTSVVNAFAGSTNFQNNFNNGNAVNVNAPVNATIAANIIFNALGTIPSLTQINAWVATHISVSAMVAEFALGDQYSARTAPFVQNYLTHIALEAAGLPGAVAPSGSLFAQVTTDATVTDNTVGHTTTAGNTITFTISTEGVTAGTVENWALTGAALGEVTSGPSGSVMIGANGMATVTVQTNYTGIGSAALTFDLTSVNPVAADTVTLTPPVTQTFNGTPEVLLGAAGENTIFQGIVDAKIVGANTFLNFLSVSQGGANATNTLELFVDNDTNHFTITPGNSTNLDTDIQVLQVTDLGDANYFNLQYMPNLMTINDVGSTNSDYFYNVQNLVNVGVINSDFPTEGFVTVTVINSVAPGAITVTLENSGYLELTYGNTAGMDVVTEYDFVVSGDNDLDLFGSQNTTTITVSGPAGGAPSASLWLHFDTSDGFYDTDENNLYMLNFVDASGLSGAIPATDKYQFGFDAVNIYQGAGSAGPFMFNGAQGNTYVDLKLEVSESDGTAVVGEHGEATPYTYEAQGGTFDITTFGGNDYIHINAYEGYGETINVNAGDGNTSSTNTGSKDGGDYVDIHDWRATYQTLNVTDGDGNNTVKIVSADYATVDVQIPDDAGGFGNNTVTVDLWDGQEYGYSAAQVTVNVGDGTNDVTVNTDETGSPYNDEGYYGGKVDVTAGNGNDDYVNVTNGFEYTDNITVGNGNYDTVDVTNYGYYANTTITVGTGYGISVDYNEIGNVYSYEDLVTINLGDLLGGDSSAGGTVDVTIQDYDTLNLNAGDGSYAVDVTLAEYLGDGHDVVNITMGNGNNDITVTDGGGTDDDVTIMLGNGDNDINVNLDDNTDSTVTIGVGGGDNFIKVTLDTATPTSDLTITTGDGNNTVEVYGVAGNTVDVTTGAGNDGIFVDSLTLPATITLNGGGGYNTLGLDGNQTALQPGAQYNAITKTVSTPALAAASISHFQALEIFGPMVNGIDVLDLGANGSNLVNNINQVVLTAGYNDTGAPFGDLLLTGLNNNAELDLLWGHSQNQTLYVPLGNAGANPVDFFNLMLDSQFGDGGNTITHHYGMINLEDAAGGGTVTTVNMESTSYEGIYPPDAPTEDYNNVYNEIGLDDHGLSTVNLWSLGGGDQDAAAVSMVGGNPFAFGGAQQDGDAFLILDTSDLGGMTSFNATNATNGGHGDFLAGLDADFRTDTALTVNANQTTEDNISFGGGAGDHMSGTKIYVGNYDNSITEDAGSNTSNDVITLAQQTESVYSVTANGANTVTLNNGTGNTINVDGNPGGAPDDITIGITHTGVLADAGFLNGDVINLGGPGSGIVQNDVVIVNGSNSNPWESGGVPDAIVNVNINSTGGGNNHITMNYVTGSDINLGTHTLTDTIYFNHVTDSALGYNDTITGFNGATAAHHDIIDLSGVIGGDSHTFQLANGALAVAVLANGNTGTNDSVIYDYANGTLYDFHHGATFATATEANTMQIQVGVIGIGHFTANEITF
jgi:hypothetical protein